MARFQAQTNAVLDQELEQLRERLGLAPSQKADLLREVAAIASWVVRQAERGRAVEARLGSEVETFDHPAISRLVARSTKAPLPTLALTGDEVDRLELALERPFDPTPALRSLLADLAAPERRVPGLRWAEPAD